MIVSIFNLPTRQALAESRNRVAVWLARSVGVENTLGVYKGNSSGRCLVSLVNLRGALIRRVQRSLPLETPEMASGRVIPVADIR